MKAFGQRLPEQLEAVGAPPGTGFAAPEPVAPAVPNDEGQAAALREKVLKQIDPSAAATLTAEELRGEIEGIIHVIANSERLELTARQQMHLADEMANDMIGFGPLQALLQDDDISDIMVNGPASVYVERHGRLERSTIRFRDNDHIAAIAQKIASRAGRRIDEASPMVDARLPDGSRVNVVFPPLAIDSPCISIRRFPRKRYNIESMIGNGTLSRGVARMLEIAARARLNLLISGGTGSGKTTLLNAMSHFIGHNERIITIEDAAELQLQQPHVIRLETRPRSMEGTGQVTQRDLVWNALRMRPDRIIVGEVRGGEAFDMLQAMNTGHDGSISTIHANTARDALVRVENMLQMAQVALPLGAIRAQLVSALDIVVQVERMRDGQRRVVQVTEVCGLEGDVITTNDLCSFEVTDEGSDGRLSGRYLAPYPHPGFMPRLAYFGLDRAWAEATRQV